MCLAHRRYRHIINDMYGHHDMLYPSKWLRRQKEAGRDRERQRETASDKDSARPRCEVETFADVKQGADAALAARCPSTSRPFASRRPPKRGVRNSAILMPMTSVTRQDSETACCDRDMSPIRRPTSPTLRASNRPPQRFPLENKEKPCKLHTPTRPQTHPPILTHTTTSVVCVHVCLICGAHMRACHERKCCPKHFIRNPESKTFYTACCGKGLNPKPHTLYHKPCLCTVRCWKDNRRARMLLLCPDPSRAQAASRHNSAARLQSSARRWSSRRWSTMP
jgi:hypothetical protein